MDRLNNLLADSRTNGDLYTHVLLGGIRGKVNIGAVKTVDFWENYIKCVEAGEELYVAEKPQNELPILVDIDLETRYKEGTANRKKLYSMDNVKRIIKEYQRTMRDILGDDDENIRDEMLTCVLLEKEPSFLEINGIKYIKNGFHLHFPKYFTDVSVQKAYIIPIVSKNLTGMFDKLYTLDDGTCSSVDLSFL